MARLDRQAARDHRADAATGKQSVARTFDPPPLSLHGSVEPRAGRASEGAPRAEPRRAGVARGPDHHQRHFRRLAEQRLSFLARASAVVRALRLHVNRIERLARGHEQAVSLLAAEAEIGAAFRQADLTDPLAVIGRKHLDAVIAFADPARADPDIAFGVDPQAVRET